MRHDQLIAKVVGVLFITGTVAGLLSVALTRSILDDSDYLAEAAENETPLIAGAILVLIMAFALAMIPVVLFPLLRTYNEILALGAVLFRGALEAAVYIGIAVCWLLFIPLGDEYAASAAADTAGQESMGAVLQEAEEWSAHILSIVFSLGAAMVYGLFYISYLIPRWLSIWGLAGAALYLISPLLAMSGLDGFGVLMVPLAIQEMVFALWLIVKGFNRPAAEAATRPGFAPA